MKARRLFILALALLLAVALMTTALVACNPDKGEDTTGENPDAGENPSKGDVIFTEDATLAGIKAAMSMSVSYTYEYTDTFDNENEPYCREVYYITENVARVLCEERDLESGEWSVVYEEYLVEHSGGFFRVYAEQGNWAAEKASTTCEQLRATMYDGVLGCLIESHGAIVPDESVLKNGTHYVEGSARVSLEGARLQLSITYWNRETSPVSSTERYVLRGVNTTTVEAPAGIMEAIEVYLKGDVIFTEDATLAGIKAALDAAENVTYKYHGSAGDFEYDYIYRFARDCVVAEAVENYDGQERHAIYYAVLKDGVFYDVACEDGQWSVDKNLASNTDADSLPSGLFDEYVFTVPFALEEVDGKLQPKDGAGVLSLDGDSVTLTFEKKEDGVTVQTEAYSLSLVNATEVTVPADVLERINAADWSDEVRYNGIDYNKTLTGASGEETTVYVYDDKNLPLEVTPETTINGFPVFAESGLAQQSAGDAIFTEGATSDEMIAAVDAAESYTYVHTLTRDGESEPCRIETTYVTTDAIKMVVEERDDESGEMKVTSEGYIVISSGECFMVVLREGNLFVENSLMGDIALFMRVFAGLMDCLVTRDGVITVNESDLVGDDFAINYVEGSASVSLEGYRLQVQFYSTDDDGTYITETYIYEGVNATTVEVPEEVANAVEAAYATL